ncbi:MAG: transglutaminaseTgpA domain-containing protein [Halobacteriaceae archaeon]
MTETVSFPVVGGRVAWPDLLRGGAAVSVAVLVGSYLAVLFHVVTVVGGVAAFVPLVVAVVSLAVLLGRYVDVRVAAALGAVMLVGGLTAYLVAVPTATLDAGTLQQVGADVVSLLTGFSVLQLTRAGVWALAVTPGPTFLATYLVVRGSYVRAAAVGALTLGFFVLTGDSTLFGTLAGTLGAAGALGFATLARRGAGREGVEAVAIGLAFMIVATAAAGAVPQATGGGGGSGPTTGGATTTLEGSLTADERRAEIQGPITLSPRVRFTVQASQPEYWRAGAYDRFTGSAWVRTGQTDPVTGTLFRPEGPSDRVVQRYRFRDTVGVLPAAAEPYRVRGDVGVLATDQRTIRPNRTLQPDENVTVTSYVLNRSVAHLDDAGTDYPPTIEERYLQVPGDTPDRVGDLADRVTADAETPYQTAVAIEKYLEAEKSYSLDVERPEGNIVDGFLFEMDQGYCTYYASSMVTMLREEGVPARFVVGYTQGRRLGGEEYVVRGLDSHAWVEVYFPEYGWVRFDPTPAQPRRAAERQRIQEARSSGAVGVDVAERQFRDVEVNVTTTTVNESFNYSDPGVETGPTAGANATTAPSRGPIGGADLPELPDPETLAVWAVVGLGALAVLRRAGVLERGWRAVWLRYQPDGDPDEVVEGAWSRVEYLLGRTRRHRYADETVSEYLHHVAADDRARRVGEIRERMRHAGHVTPALAEEARELAAEFVAERAGDNV